MARIAVLLERGLMLGTVAQTTAVLREPTAGDIFDAAEDCERLIATPDGYQLVASPTRMGLAVLARQIESVGEISGPLSMAMLRKLSGTDLDRLQKEADKLSAASVEVADRGRSADVGATAGESDDAAHGEPGDHAD